MKPWAEQVIAMLDLGVPHRRIARDAGVSIDYVKHISSHYSNASFDRQEARQHAKIRAASKAHERAILATGKRYS